MTRVVVDASVAVKWVLRVTTDEHYLRKARPVGGIVHLREARLQ